MSLKVRERKGSSSSSSSSSSSPRSGRTSPFTQPVGNIMRYLGPWYPGIATGEACLLGVAIGGDLVSLPRGSSGISKYLPQLLDNLTHAVIAALVWWTAIAPDISRSSTRMSSRLAAQETLGALVAGSFVDLDHFVAAGSTQMKDALNLSSRPLGHCVSVVVLESVVAWAASECLPCGRGRGLRHALIVAASGISHQLRDSTRRGMWFCPLGSTPKLPYALYLLVLAGLPLLVRGLLLAYGQIGAGAAAGYSHVPVQEDRGRIEIV